MTEMIDLRTGRRIHLVGIGGAGLSAIARVLLERGCHVSGSDLLGNERTQRLADDGARINIGHDAAHVAGADLLLATSAVSDDHVELQAARRMGMPVIRRREILPALTRGQDTIAVAGAHGKTTTTAMIATILRRAGKDPSFIVGGDMGDTGVNAGSGEGDAFVIEADEYDNMFLGLSPSIAVVTNVEHDHPDFFATREQLQEAFARFVDRLPAGGALIACMDDAGARELLRQRAAYGRPVISYGFGAAADWRIDEVEVGVDSNRARVKRGGETAGWLRLGLPGRHNLLNALAAAIVAEMRGVSFRRSERDLERVQERGATLRDTGRTRRRDAGG